MKRISNLFKKAETLRILAVPVIFIIAFFVFAFLLSTLDWRQSVERFPILRVFWIFVLDVLPFIIIAIQQYDQKTRIRITIPFLILSIAHIFSISIFAR